MLSGFRISQQLRDPHALPLGFYGYNSNWINCCHHRSHRPSHLSSSFVLSFPFSFGCNFVQLPFRSCERFFRFKLLPTTHSYSSSASPHPSVSNTTNDEDPALVSFVNNESCVRSAINPPPLLSSCLSPAGDVPDPPTARLSPVAGGTVALGKFDALHIGHRELAIQAAEIGVPFLLSFVGMAEILGWEPRGPIVANVIESEFFPLGVCSAIMSSLRSSRLNFLLSDISLHDNLLRSYQRSLESVVLLRSKLPVRIQSRWLCIGPGATVYRVWHECLYNRFCHGQEPRLQRHKL